MGFVEIFLVGIGLSMDAFAVSVAKGLSMKRLSMGQAAVIALFFGGFQALMPTLGWFIGAQFNELVSAFEGWIAFILLAVIGGKMLWEAFHDNDDDDEEFKLDLRELFMLAIATSIDAFAAGIAFALLDVNIAVAALLIGATTFALSFAGVVIGHQFGSRWEKPATIIGGITLIAIGVKILAESLLGS